MKSARILLSLLVPLALAQAARAEVAVELDDDGHLVALKLDPGASRRAIWSPVTGTRPTLLLNPNGDRFRDLPPVSQIIAMPMEDPNRIHAGRGRGGAPQREDGPGDPEAERIKTAVVVWPRFEGSHYELVYSLWDPRAGSWRAPGYVLGRPLDGDDQAPWLYAASGRVYLVWRNGAAALLARGKPVGVNGAPDIKWEPPVVITPDTVVDGIPFWTLAGLPPTTGDAP